MVTRTFGPYDYYGDVYDGITGDAIRDSIDPLGVHLDVLGTLSEDLVGDEQKILETTEGRVLKVLTSNTQVPQKVANRLATKAHFACGCTRLYANHIDTFDRAVNGINVRYNSMAHMARNQIQLQETDKSLEKLRDEIRTILDPEYTAATTAVEQAADDVAEMLEGDPSPGEIRTLFRQGLIPLSIMTTYFPEVYLSTEDREAAYAAHIEQTLEQLREEGLLAEGDPGPLYRRWIENSDSNGISLDTIMAIIRDHDINPDDFEVLVGMQEVVDPDGKSFFILPGDISGSDARKAVEMTYIFNAGTDYGTANGGDTDFIETPYSSDEIQRIIDRQGDNNWFSYDDDVGFVHDNDGRLATTPNGMLMGVGGKGIFSQNGGTTWGDIFMLNIDDPDDPVQALVDTVESGRANYQDDDGDQYSGNLDLDQLLHHEEMHSQQWADSGYGKFIAGYGWQALIHGGDGAEISYEKDAGLTDGGYE